jgi:DNA-binding GntR family transcriptional regulator
MPPSKDSFSTHVREYLLQQIASGRLSPGERIVEARVAEHFDISAIPVREAIRELMTMRVLESAPHRGAWVRSVSLQETIEAFEIRSVLEPLAAPAAARVFRNKANRLRRLGRNLVATARKHDFAKFQAHNQDFHRMIVKAGDNGVLLRTWDSLAFEVRTRFVMDFLTVVDPVEIANEHGPIVEALETGDARTAARLLKSHSAGLVKYLQKQAARQDDEAVSI